MKKISILIRCFNEKDLIEKSILEIIKKYI